MNREQEARFRRLAKPQANGCWLWTGDGSPSGYGMFRPVAGGPRHMIHRWAYEQYVGPIPEGMQIDHTCHTQDTSCPGGNDCQHRRCCNPDHLEPVTASENTIRQRHYQRGKESCPKGHPYEGGNLITGRDGKRRCRSCDVERKRRYRNSTRSPSAMSE